MKQREKTDGPRRTCVLLGGLSLALALPALLWKAVFCFPGLVLAAVCLGRLSRMDKPGPGERGLDRCAKALAAAGGLICLLVAMAFTVRLTGSAGLHLF